MSNLKTFSYNAKVIDIGVFTGWTLPFRFDCDGCVRVISETGRDHIYVTNYADFQKDMERFEENSSDGIKAVLFKRLNLDAIEKEPSHSKTGLLKGMQFDVIELKGLLLTSYTYVLDSMRTGGYGSYSSK